MTHPEMNRCAHCGQLRLFCQCADDEEWIRLLLLIKQKEFQDYADLVRKRLTADEIRRRLIISMGREQREILGERDGESDAEILTALGIKPFPTPVAEDEEERTDGPYGVIK